MSDFDRDETDKTMQPEVVPAYEAMKARAVTAGTSPDGKTTVVRDYVRIKGRKVACVLYLTQTASGIDEQFEYYTYHYNHHRTT